MSHTLLATVGFAFDREELQKCSMEQGCRHSFRAATVHGLGAENDPAREGQHAARPAAHPWNDRRISLLPWSVVAASVVRSKRAPLKVPQSRTWPRFTM